MTNQLKEYGLESHRGTHFFNSDSVWSVKETKLSVIFECIKKGTGMDDDAPTRIVCKKDNRCNHKLDRRVDGTYTIWWYRFGYPWYFYPLTNAKRITVNAGLLQQHTRREAEEGEIADYYA